MGIFQSIGKVFGKVIKAAQESEMADAAKDVEDAIKSVEEARAEKEKQAKQKQG